MCSSQNTGVYDDKAYLCGCFRDGYGRCNCRMVTEKIKSVIVAGSRTYQNKDHIFEVLDYFHSIYSFDNVVCGMANGPDLIGKEWAETRGVNVIESHANWKLYGNSAGVIRNTEMSKIADYLICFWDHASPGTKDMISKMKGRTLCIYNVSSENNALDM